MKWQTVNANRIEGESSHKLRDGICYKYRYQGGLEDNFFLVIDNPAGANWTVLDFAANDIYSYQTNQSTIELFIAENEFEDISIVAMIDDVSLILDLTEARRV